MSRRRPRVGTKDTPAVPATTAAEAADAGDAADAADEREDAEDDAEDADTPRPKGRDVPAARVADPDDLRERLRVALPSLPRQRWFQVLVCTLLTLAHLVAFQQAASRRLGIPFNLAPGAHIAFPDPMAPSLGPHPRQPPNWSRLAPSRFDAQHYEGFALRGLDACPTNPADSAGGRNYLQCGLGWLPAYGQLGGLVMKVTGWEPDVALIAISVLSAIILNLLWISPTIVKRIGRFEAWALLIAWNCYPAAWNLVAPETEALVLVLAIGGLVMLCNERWVWSAVLIGACTALRLPTAAFAFALGCCLLFAAWDGYRRKAPRWWRPLVAVPLCGWGQFAYMAYFQIKLGNWHAFFDARFAFGDKNRLDRLTDVTYFLKGFQGQAADMIVYLALIAIIALTARRALAGFRAHEKWFLVIASATTAILAVAGAMQWWGIDRYMMLCPLPFLGMGVLARRHRAVYVLWLLLSVAIYWHFELCSYITQGDSQACPCLGRVELREPWNS